MTFNRGLSTAKILALLQPLRWSCVKRAIHREREEYVREE